MKKLWAAVVACGALCAPVMMADTIQFMDHDGNKLRTEFDAVITSWNCKEVGFTKSDKGTSKVSRRDIVALARTTGEKGSKSEEMENASALVVTKPSDAKGVLEAIVKSGGAIDKEEAMFLLGEAAANDRRASDAAKNFKAYVSAYKDGYFAQEAYTQLANLLIRAKDYDGARQAYKDMAGAGSGSGLDVLGNQGLGELEFAFGKERSKEAIAAFKNAATAAGLDKNARYKANAWQAKTLIASGDSSTGKAMLEDILKDDQFDDKNSGDDEEVLNIAYHSLADIYFTAKNYEQAYDAYTMAAFYDWWLSGSQEGYCMAHAWYCAKKTTVGADIWKTRMDALELLAGAHKKDFDAVKALDAKEPPK